MKNEIKINNRFFYKKLVLSADSCLSVKFNGKSHTLYKLKISTKKQEKILSFA